MANRNKPNLKHALKKVDDLDEELFGNINIDVSTLPCFKKIRKEKITINLDSDLLAVIKKLAKKYHIPYNNIMNDALRRVFIGL